MKDNNIKIIAWIITMIIVLAGLYITKSAWCVCGIIAPVMMNNN